MKRFQVLLALSLMSGAAFATTENTMNVQLAVEQFDNTNKSLLEQFEQATPLVVVAPAHFNGMELPVSNKRKVTLTVQKSTPNDFGDEAENAWYESHRDGIPYRRYWFGDLKVSDQNKHFLNMPLQLGDLWRSEVEVHKGYNVFLYGEHKYDRDCGYDPYLAIITDPEATRIERVLDFSKVLQAFQEKVMTGVSGGFSSFASPSFYGCTIEGSTMYVAVSHSTYASSSKGKNAYLMAVDMNTGKIKWMTKPLTCNSQFAITGNSIICGYGFSGESHYVYVVDKNTGRRSKGVWVKKSPELFSIEGSKVYSRMYAYDYVFNMK